MTVGYYHPGITFEDVFDQKFDLYGLGVILKKLFLEDKKIFENYKNTGG